ncbi:MAG: polyprenyl synthetase family protein [Bacteroidales bacterium]|nr:polyprenyl synthetase family protein [Candidatus Cryptobacteroides aphodequi]
MSRDQIISFLGEDWNHTLELIHSALDTDISLLAETNDGVLRHSGKLLRPMLTLLSCRACSPVCTPDSMVYAAAVELLHNATLLHDDVADGATLRRGEPTVAAKLGASSAVLVGDFWLARAVKLAIGTSYRQEVLELFTKTLSDLAEGEMLQLEKASLADTDLAAYYRIIYCKTASLFESACVSGALAADATKEQIEAIRRYARAMGIAFQIKDDILDYSGGESLGKPVGIDLKERKITLPLLGAMENHPREKEIRSMVAAIPEHPEYCAEICAFVHACRGVEYAYDKMKAYVDEAVAALEPLSPGKARDFLAQIALFNSERNS